MFIKSLPYCVLSLGCI